MGSCDTVSPGAAFFGAHVFGTVQLKICKRYRVGSSPVKGVGSFSCVLTVSVQNLENPLV